MTETIPQIANADVAEPRLPSGYTASEQLIGGIVLGREMLPWLDDDAELSVASCTLQSGHQFYMASAVGTHDKLVKAAKGMNSNQQRNVDNMFYSRLPEFVQNGHAPNIETLPQPSTPFPIKVMRNQGGQRLYFGVVRTLLRGTGTAEPVVTRLAVCDKNKQGLVLDVLSGMSIRHSRNKGLR